MQYWSIKLCCYPLGNTVWNAGLISVLNFLYRNLRSRIQRLILFSSPSLSKYHSSRIEQICNTVPQTTCTYTTLYCICTLITGTAWQEAGSLRQVHKRGEGRRGEEQKTELDWLVRREKIRPAFELFCYPSHYGLRPAVCNFSRSCCAEP